MLRNGFILGALASLALSACAHGSGGLPLPASPPRAASLSMPVGSIAWRHWGAEAFAEAKRENKIVLVDVGIEGCTACRWMYEETYRDPEVVRRVQAHFIPIAVDADQEPDVGERYEAWGWTATVFLLPDGEQVKAIEGSEPSKTFVPELDALVDLQARHQLHADGSVVQAKAAPADTIDVARFCRLGIETLDDRGYDKGWGRGEAAMHYVMATPVEWVDYRSKVYGDTRDAPKADGLAEGLKNILDPVWGGVFVAAHGAGWSEPIVEKRLVQEAYALETFGRQYARTHDAKWLDAAKQLDAYDARWMLAPDGTFYSTQQDDAPNLPEGMDASDYYKLPEAKRLAYGVPPIDHAIYTDQNAILASAYLSLYSSTGDARWLDVAKRTVEALTTKRLTPDGWYRQADRVESVKADSRKRAALFDGRLYLKAQTEMGRALLALHAMTGETKWVEVATAIAKVMRSRLEDPRGGFFNTEARDTDALTPRRKAFYDNAVAARFLLDLATITKDDTLETSAKRTIAAIADEASGEDTTAVASFALAVERLALGPTSVTITGPSTDPRYQALLLAAALANEPRPLIHADLANTYPAGKDPAAYVCTTNECSSPVKDPSRLAEVIRKVSVVRSGDGCRR
jgi:uncharacterized protein